MRPRSIDVRICQTVTVLKRVFMSEGVPERLMHHGCGVHLVVMGGMGRGGSSIGAVACVWTEWTVGRVEAGWGGVDVVGIGREVPIVLCTILLLLSRSCEAGASTM